MKLLSSSHADKLVKMTQACYVLRVNCKTHVEKLNMFCFMSVLFKATVLLKHTCHRKPLFTDAAHSSGALS